MCRLTLLRIYMIEYSWKMHRTSRAVLALFARRDDPDSLSRSVISCMVQGTRCRVSFLAIHFARRAASNFIPLVVSIRLWQLTQLSERRRSKHCKTFFFSNVEFLTTFMTKIDKKKRKILNC